MGHLINPIALRMGWSSNWMDLYFVDNKYYPQYLHMLFRMRLLLGFIFSGWWFERKAGFFHSHFLFTKDYHSLLLRIFFYDGKTETLFYTIEDYIREDKLYLYRNVTPATYHERKSETFFRFYVFFVFFRLFRPFNLLSQWSKAFLEHNNIERIAGAFFSFDQRLLRSVLGLPRPSTIFDPHLLTSLKLCEETHFHFFYFYLICRNLALMQSRDSLRLKTKPYEFIQRFTFIYSLLSKNNFIFQTLRPYLTYLMNYLSLNYKNCDMQFVQISFLAITNENVTAAFIARFIALKLRQGFTARELLNPLRKEFKRLLRRDAHLGKPLRLPFEFFLRRLSHRSYFSSLFRTLIRKLAILFSKRFHSIFLSQRSLITYDSFLFLDYLLHSSIAFISKKYFTYYFYFCLFNYHRMLPYYQLLLHDLLRKISALRYYATLDEYLPLALFPSLVEQIGVNSFENYSSWEGTSISSPKPSLLASFLWSFRRRMHFFYSQQSHHYLAKATLATNRWLRLFNPKTSSERRLGLRGFKIQCVGRFTRRQRSVKLTWSKASVPLNTFSAIIDYATFSVMLVNSAVNVRVWFHRDEGFQEYYLKII